jgi:hypothetical protein
MANPRDGRTQDTSPDLNPPTTSAIGVIDLMQLLRDAASDAETTMMTTIANANPMRAGTDQTAARASPNDHAPRITIPITATTGLNAVILDRHVTMSGKDTETMTGTETTTDVDPVIMTGNTQSRAEGAHRDGKRKPARHS